MGARLFLLPKYLPDLNPIEQVFAKLKHLLRKAQARTRDAVCATIGQLLATYTPQECANNGLIVSSTHTLGNPSGFIANDTVFVMNGAMSTCDPAPAACIPSRRASSACHLHRSADRVADQLA